MNATKLIKSGSGQVVRLPKEFHFEGNEVVLRRVGKAVVILPKMGYWEVLIQSLPKFSDDFMNERDN